MVGWLVLNTSSLHGVVDGCADREGAGLPNLFWWCERENGIAGILATQILPFCGRFLRSFEVGVLKGRVGKECDVDGSWHANVVWRQMAMFLGCRLISEVLFMKGWKVRRRVVVRVGRVIIRNSLRRVNGIGGSRSSTSGDISGFDS